ncbi:MAG: hypothetical protein H6883_14340 [Rhodobiaceae bacterium]|nr:hypothetical protein [Rhodobiaceae bacterium]MCC0057296.1 hypothetical protein [Rhodobiaceae bacterium]
MKVLRRIALILVVLCLTPIAAIALLFPEGFVNTASPALYDPRPALLRDAQWQDPASAKSFNARFHAGVPAMELVEWLGENDFAINFADQRANLMIQGLPPCNDLIIIFWKADDAGLLIESRAVIAQSCL